MNDGEVKITMRYYGCSREDAVQALEDGNDEALYAYSDECTYYAELDFNASDEW